MNKGDRNYLGFGAVLGVLLSILIIALVLCGIYAASIYSKSQAEQQARIQIIQESGTTRCNLLGYDSYDRVKNVCFTEKIIDYQKNLRSYEELGLR